MAAAVLEIARERLFASPLARRRAKEAGVDIALVTGSGPHGRIVERDVAAAIAGGVSFAPTTPVETYAPPPALSDAVTRKYYAAGSYDEVPLDSMRRAIAQRLTDAVRNIPHFYLETDCEIDALLRLREECNAAAPGADAPHPEWKLSVNDFLVKALALALQRVPDANVTFTSSALLRHKSSDVGVAVSIPGGLVTPIIRNAETKSLRAISAEIKELAARGKDRRLKPSEYEGGVSAVSNLGMFGVKRFSAVINPPQSTILAVGAGEKRIVADASGAPRAATVISVTLSCDHRAVDGALGAALLAEFKRVVERPAALIV